VDAYRFLVDNYEEGDELYFFGFSRGAFTARSVAGLVRNSGILRRENQGRVPDAYRLYRSEEDKPRGITSTLFRSAYSYEPDIRFVGVWDTVGALGIPPAGPRFLRGLTKRFNKRWAFHDTDLSTHVRAAFQALAIDEQRSAFKPTLWHKQPDAGDQVLEQVWFAGVHCNVGGGFADTSLSDLALLWMVQKAQEHELAFAPGAFAPRPAGIDEQFNAAQTTAFTVAPDALRLPDRSRKGIYLLAGKWNRPIGVETGEDGGYGQTVANSAVQLRDKKPDDYQPPRLIDYLERQDRPEATEIPLVYVADHH